MIHATKDTFDELVQTYDKVIVDFWADWCVPCKTMDPVFEQIEADPDIDVQIVKVNIEDEPELKSRFAIMGIPAFHIYEEGKIVREDKGARPLSAMVQLIFGE